MFEEFFRALKVPGTPVKTFRLRVLLFPAAEEPMTPEELADAQHFFSTSRCAPAGPRSRRSRTRVLRGQALIFCSDPAACLLPAEGLALCCGPAGKAWCFCVAAFAGPGCARRQYDDGACWLCVDRACVCARLLTGRVAHTADVQLQAGFGLKRQVSSGTWDSTGLVAGAESSGQPGKL